MSSDLSLDAMVQEDLLQLQNTLAVGSVSTFYFTFCFQVSVSQETTDFLCSFIQKFDIFNFNAQDVSEAARKLHSVGHYLGDELPSNAVPWIFDGMAKADNEGFEQFCATQKSLYNLHSYHESMKNVPLHKQINNAITNLELLYKDKCAAHTWDGIGHEVTSIFLIEKPSNRPTNQGCGTGGGRVNGGGRGQGWSEQWQWFWPSL